MKLSRALLWFLAGFSTSALIIALYFLHQRPSAGGYESMSVKEIAPPPRPVGYRVHGVVQEWSGSSTFSDGDQLTDIWNTTRVSGNHDYPFEQGGSDSLAKLLNTEFKHAPAATFKLTAQNFPPNGAFKTVAQLITSYSGNVLPPQ